MSMQTNRLEFNLEIVFLFQNSRQSADSGV